jgi:hypothetical protein
MIFVHRELREVDIARVLTVRIRIRILVSLSPPWSKLEIGRMFIIAEATIATKFIDKRDGSTIVEAIRLNRYQKPYTQRAVCYDV